MDPILISAVIITYNDAERIRPCLESIRWVDEIVVVDMGSTDSTVAICREFTQRLYRRGWLPYADPLRNEAIALARGKWVLMLDADERVSPALAEELQTLAAANNLDVVLVPYWFMSFGYRRTDPLAAADAMPRFFRKGALRWPAEVHGRPDLSGLRVVRLSPQEGHYILHDAWQTTAEVLDKINRYTAEEARLLRDQGVRFTPSALVRETLRELGRGAIYEAYRNGVMGLVNIGFTAFYRFVVWARLWELEGRPRAHDRLVERWGQWLSFLPRLAFRVWRAARRR